MPDPVTTPDLTAQISTAVEAAVARVADAFTLNFNQMQARLDGVVQGLSASRAPEPPKKSELTNEQINEAIANGENPAEFVRQMIASEIERRVDPQVGQLREVGLGAMATLVRQTALKDAPHYERYKKEVDAAIAYLPPDQQVNQDMVRLAYNTIVGGHFQEIQDERDRARGLDQGTQEPGGSARLPGTKELDPYEKVRAKLGDEAVEALRQSGHTPDEFARRLGRGKYKDWDDYQEQTKRFLV